MFLDTVNNITLEQAVDEPVYAPWSYFPYTDLVHHGCDCCRKAKAWLEAMDFSQLNNASIFTGPRWLLTQYAWGPSIYPMYWCEAVKKKTLDCGALGVLARACFNARGLTCFPLQLVQQYNLEATQHWASRWNEEKSSTHWLREYVMYHEGAAVLQDDNTLKLWDASSGWWLNPDVTTGYGGVRAVRIHTPAGTSVHGYPWGKHTLRANEWTLISTE